jgi:hypothetical protein
LLLLLTFCASSPALLLRLLLGQIILVQEIVKAFVLQQKMLVLLMGEVDGFP